MRKISEHPKKSYGFLGHKKSSKKISKCVRKLRFQTRGQVTIFIIIGIIILISFIIFFYLNREAVVNPLETEPTETISFEKDPFDEYVRSCIERKAYPAIKLMSELGGTMQLDNYRFYDGLPYRFFLRYDSCDQNRISKVNMQAELNDYLESQLITCFDFKDFIDQKYIIEFPNGFPEPKVTSIISSDEVAINLVLPFKVSKQGYSIDFKDFRETIQIPLGRLYDLALTISDQESQNNYFDKDAWMVDHGEEIQIEKHKPYPDIVYSLSQHLDNYGFTLFFNFGMKGKEIASTPGASHPNKKKCYSDVPITLFSDSECEGGCKSCILNGITIPHGGTWCNYDGTTQPGKALVGSRHYLLSCNNGHFYVEECADYREEICVQSEDEARCRPNQWQNCVFQTNSGSCASAGDCYWYDYLAVNFESKRAPLDPDKIEDVCATPAASTERSKCVPYVPPGSKFWEGSADNYCNMANQLTAFYQPTFTEIEAINIPNYWTEYTNANCFFIGDCGNYMNLLGDLSKGGYWDLNIMARGYDEFIDYSKLNIPPQIIHLESNINNYQTASYNPIVNANEINDYLFSYSTLAMEWANEPCKADQCGTQPFDCDCFCPFCAVKAPDHTDISCSSGDAYLREIYKDFVKWVPGATVCSQWTAPSSGNCNSCYSDELRPCSEYRCKSLGQNCQYYEIYGIPYCGDLSDSMDEYYLIVSTPDHPYYSLVTYPNNDNYGHPGDPDYVAYHAPLEIEFDNSFLPAGYTSSDMSFSAYAQIIKGHTILPEANLGSELNIKFDTNKPAKCKISYVPSTTYYDEIAYLVEIGRESGYNKDHDFSYSITSFDSLLNQLTGALGLTSMLQLPINIGLDQMFNYLIQAVNSNKIYIFADCIDQIGNRKQTFFLYSIDTSSNNPPEIELISPSQGEIILNLNNTFNFTVADDLSDSITCNLYYGSGTILNWSVIGTTFVPSPSSSSFQVEFEKEPRTYIWNVECNDGLSSSFAQTNRTFTIG